MDKTIIPDNLCRRAGMSASWKSANTVGVFPYAHITYKSKDSPSVFAPSDAFVHLIRPQVILYNPILRKLINEANDIFLRIQHVDKSNKNMPTDMWLKMSRRYRSIIRECLESLQEAESKNEDSAEEYSSYVTIFYSIECIWHLCEILYVDQVPGDVILNSLLEWICFHFPEHERKATKFLASFVSCAEVDEHYWDTVIGMFLHGQIDVVRALLKLHSACESAPFQIADNILQTMPLYNVYGGVSINDFTQRWNCWQLDTRTKIDSKTFATQEKLELIVKLAVGDNDLWETEGADRCETWYEYLTASLLYKQPFITRSHLGQWATKCYKSWPAAHANRHIDQTLLAILQQDLYQVIHEIQQMSENGWFAAHIIDLLYHCGELEILNSEIKKVSRDLRNSLLHDYGSILMEHHSLWQVGSHYLSYSGKPGLHRLKLHLERLALGSEARSMKIIQIAQKFEFQDTIISICRQRAMLAIRRNRPGHALSWTLRSKDTYLSSYLADLLLKNYCLNRSLDSPDLLDSLGSSMLISDRLIFLGKYFEFHKVYQTKKFKEAGNLLISLLASKLTPKYFWEVLFTDAVPLLECDEIVLNSNETYEFLHCLEQNVKDQDLPEEQIELIRLAAARNLARALTQEIQTVS